VRVAGHELEAAVQQLSTLIELAEVHVAEAQVVEEIGIVGILAEELLQLDAGLVKAACGEELVGAGEVVGHCERRWAGNIKIVILAEIFHARPGEVEEMIQRRQEENGTEEREEERWTAAFCVWV
jgi:hypothetical protein